MGEVEEWRVVSSCLRHYQLESCGGEGGGVGWSETGHGWDDKCREKQFARRGYEC